MKLHRFYAPMDMDGKETHVLPDLALIHQIGNVLKMKKGDRLIFFNGSGKDYMSEIISFGKEILEFKVIETRVSERHSNLKLSLAFSLIKKDNVEWILQKCTELGVAEFIPLISDRSEKKGFNMERARKIVIEACEQSGRGEIPKIREPQNLKNFLYGERRAIAAFHTEGKKFDRQSFRDQKEIVLCVGPEGGWTDNEIFLFKEKKVSVVCLDAPILRAETAAIAVSSLFLLL